ncbi:MAG: RHS repeat-associated core domain-containing protein [Oscillospiraceae bacterium]
MTCRAGTDPETCRFINADKFMATGDGILNYNMFAYCGNNPINLSDPEGEIAGIAIFGVFVLVVVGCCFWDKHGNVWWIAGEIAL